MKTLHLRFYPYISAIVIVVILAIAMLAMSVYMFIRMDIGFGIGFALFVIFLFFCSWLCLQGGIVINFKRNRLTIHSNERTEAYAIDNIKEMVISFQFDKKYMRWSAKVTIYLKNDKLATFNFATFKWKYFKNGVSLSNKNRIEREAKKYNFIKCYTAK